VALVSLLFLAVVPGTTVSGEVVSIVHGPYIQSVTWESVTIKWETSSPDTCIIHFGRDPGDLATKSVGGWDTLFSQTRFGLRMNRTYYYRVETSDVISGMRSFTTVDRGEGDFTFAVYGDSRSGHETHSDVLSLMDGHDPQFILHTGDIVNDGCSKEDWDFFLDLAHPVMEDTPLWPTRGNHDVPGPWYERYLLDGNYGDWYSFDWRRVHFVSLDSTADLSVGSEQYLWLEEDLADTRATWKFVFFHHPPYSSGKHGSYEDLRRDLDPLFAENSVTAVFNGHDHCYEHSLPPSGVHYFVTGGGGAPLYQVEGSNVTVEARSTHHFLLVSVRLEGVLIEAIDTTDDAFDQVVIGDHPVGDGNGDGGGSEDGGTRLSAVDVTLIIMLVITVIGAVLVLRWLSVPGDD